MDTALSRYLLRYYGYLLPEVYRKALQHLQVDLQSADYEASYRQMLLEKFGTNDTESLKLLEGGHSAFVEQAGRWLLAHRRDAIFLNHCAHCGGLARTPLAKQCRFCGLDWH